MKLFSKVLSGIAGSLIFAVSSVGNIPKALSGPIRDHIREEVISQRGEQIVNAVANKMIQKVNASSCDQLHTSMKGSPASSSGLKDKLKQDFYDALKENPNLKTEFFNKVAPPLMTKLFDCGMIPPSD